MVQWSHVGFCSRSWRFDSFPRFHNFIKKGVSTQEATGLSAITSAVTTALASVQSDAMSLIASVLPYALAVMGAVIVVSIGIRVFKRVAGR